MNERVRRMRRSCALSQAVALCALNGTALARAFQGSSTTFQTSANEVGRTLGPNGILNR